MVERPYRMNIFISCPFTGLCEDNKYIVKKEYQEFFNKLIEGITSSGDNYYLAVKRENWGLSHKGPEECTLSDYNGVKKCDFLIVIPGNKKSKGISGWVHIELGWASALKKKIHILIEDDFVYSPVVLGLSTLTNTKYHKCNDFLGDTMLKTIFSIIEEERRIIK